MNREAPTLEMKKERLDRILDELGSVLVAYSGGVDSAWLLKAAFDRLGGEKAIGLLAVSPSLPRAEFEGAVETAGKIGCRLEIVEAHEHENPDYVANNPNRCYFCKSELFEVSLPVAERLSLGHVVYGANVDDLGDFRPGMQAARERKIRAPLLEAGLTKGDIRELSRRAGLPTWDKAAFACLASRIPHGTAVTMERLKRVEQAEDYLRANGFRQFRVRDLHPAARIEVLPEEIARLDLEPLKSSLRLFFSGLGYSSVVVDPEGYRPGKLHTSGRGMIPGIRETGSQALGNVDPMRNLE